MHGVDYVNFIHDFWRRNKEDAMKQWTKPTVCEIGDESRDALHEVIKHEDLPRMCINCGFIDRSEYMVKKRIRILWHTLKNPNKQP